MMTPYTLHQLLRESAAGRPDDSAFEGGGGSVTYGQLDELSSRIASALIGQGIEPRDRVGLHVEKSIRAIVALFGILKAGAAYVPLDPNAPVTRVAFMVRNCGMKGLITDARRLQALESVAGHELPPVIVLADDSATDVSRTPAISWQHVLGTPIQNELPDVIEDDPAYILYTSGSTGEPKGVTLSHRAALSFANWAGDTFGIRREDRLSQHAPLHFDLSTFDIFASVRAGATTVLVPDGLAIFPLDLAKFIEAERITVWYSVPSVLTRLLLHGRLARRSLSALRLVLFAGEVFPTKYLRGVMKAIPDAEFYNLYGPTETNVCTYYRVPPLADEATAPIPIGRACANTHVFAVTQDGRIADVGEEGELYVRGPSIMLGYWGLPERTAQAMGGHPAFSGLGGRIYRTGDIVKLGHDGSYHFLGRRDNMIKSRGYRIELGEIETALYSHPAVVEAAAIAIPDDQAGHLIKALVVLSDGEISGSELEAHCSRILPKYMMPAMLDVRESLPKTSTGKVDRSGLLRDHSEHAQLTR